MTSTEADVTDVPSQPIRVSQRGRLAALMIVVLVVVVTGAAYLLRVASQTAGEPIVPAALVARGDGYLAFQRTTADAHFGTVASVPLADPDAPPQPIGLSCERIHMSAEGGICLAVDRGALTTATVKLLGPDMGVRHEVSTAGIPSRARVSPDGRWASTTTFVYGHAYAGGSFSTLTEIYDMATGKSLGSVEDFEIIRDGKPYKAADVNVWGITFADDGRTFYATVMTEGKRLLAKGDVSRQRLEMTATPAECPSLSPSGKLLAYKSATGPTTWEIRVRSLADGSESTIAEARSVDDQIEWLDDDHVLYGLSRTSTDQSEDGAQATSDVWVSASDGSGTPSLLIAAAWSPAVVSTATP